MHLKQFVLSTCMDCYKYEMVCTVLSTSFLLLWGIDLTVTSHILPVFEKKKKWWLRITLHVLQLTPAYQQQNNFIQIINRLRKYTY